MPNLSTSASDFCRVCDALPRTGLTGVGEIMLAGVELTFVVASSSASGSYPSLAMRSASSFAFFSASSKSIASAVTFLAPNLLVTFLAPRTLALRGPPAVEDLTRREDVTVRPVVGLASESGLDRGEADRAVSLAPALRKGDGVRPTTGGVAVLEMGGVGRLIAGLSHEEKKSSSGSPAGVDEPSASAPSAITTSSGYLKG